MMTSTFKHYDSLRLGNGVLYHPFWVVGPVSPPHHISLYQESRRQRWPIVPGKHDYHFSGSS